MTRQVDAVLEWLDQIIWSCSADDLKKQEPEIARRLRAVGATVENVLKELPDETLALAFKKGWRPRLVVQELLACRCHKYLFSWFCRWTRDSDIAGELINEVHCRLLNGGLNSYDPERLFSRWLCAVAHHCLVDYFRRFYRGPATVRLPEEGLCSQAWGPEDEAVARETQERVDVEVDALPPLQQYVFLRAAAGASADEIAGELKNSKQQVFRLLFRARRAVEAVLEDQEPASPRR